MTTSEPRPATGWATTFTIAAAILAAATSTLGNSVHEVTQIGLEFDPDQVEAAPGDTIRWIHTSGIHTVTSGDGCAFDGRFDEPLSSGNPVVEWIVPDDFEGEVPYFCRPHCVSNMVGNITVVPGLPCPGDIDGCGSVDFNDLLQILAAWGPCKGDCPQDVDGSGAVDFGDILLVLSTWGPCPS